jgi:DNA-directed RNA polymerase subunit M
MAMAKKFKNDNFIKSPYRVRTKRIFLVVCMVEFCKKCGSVLIPKKQKKAVKLVCPRCGYESKLKEPTSYTIAEKGKEEKEIAVIEEKEKKKRKPPEKEFEIEPMEYEEFEIEEGD